MRMVLAVVLVAGLAGCSSGPEVECLTVSDETVERIAVGDFQPTGSAAATATDEGYLVAVGLEAGGQDSAGVWWVSSLDGPGMVSSVDHVAQTVTQWPAGPLAPGDERVSDTRDCLA